MPLLDVLVTQHAEWTAKQWPPCENLAFLDNQSSISHQLAGPAFSWRNRDTASCLCSITRNRKRLHGFSGVLPRHELEANEKSSLVPGISLYEDIEMDAGTSDHQGSLSFSISTATRNKMVSQESDAASEISGSEESISSPK